MEKSLMTSKMRSVISLVDKLRDINLQSYIELPKIVAVGSQSSGKSSLVEQIVGIDFLPRGSGTVTRRPLQIRMVYQKDLPTPYAMFSEIPDKKFTNFSQVKTSIETLTDKVCGTSKNIVDKAIILDVYSAHCPNLTIIDLPGLTRIAIEGQDKNIHEVTTNMIKKYMVDPNTIILCVIPANQDISNDEVLYMARKIDKKGERTIGCITKIDIMDRGTDARALLTNKAEVQLNLGFIGIKNRSQQDIMQKKTVQQSIADQKMFFSKSPIYSSLPPACVGTTSLVNKLTKVLTDSIVKFLPDLVAKIRERKSSLSALIKEYGKPLPKTPMQKQSFLWELSSQFVNEYKKCIIGHIGSLRCGDKLLRVSNKIVDELGQVLDEQFHTNPGDQLSDKHILFALRKYEAGSMPGFPSISSFMYLLDPLLHKIKLPLQHALISVYDSLVHITDMIITEIANQYLELREHVNAKVSGILYRFRKKSNDFIQKMMEAEVGYIYTNHPMFESLQNRQTSKEEMTDDVKKNPMIVVLRKRVTAYFKIVVKNLRDLIPKNIKFLLINEATKQIQFQLFQDMSSGGSKADQLLKLGESSARQRIKNEKEYDVICKAENFLLTHSGLASYREAEMKKRIILREKQIEEMDRKRKDKKEKKQYKQMSPIKEQKQVNSIKENSFSKNMYEKRPNEQEKEKSTSNSSNNSLFENFFGKKKQEGAEIKKEKKKEETKMSTDEMFGFTSPKKKNETLPQIKEEGKNKKTEDFTDVYNREMGKTTDKAVDQLYKNEQFKQKSKQAVAEGTSIALQKQLGVSAETGKTAGKGAAWLFGQDATQKVLKQQTKKNLRQQTQMDKKG